MNKNYMQIGNRKIGEDYAPLVIAEIGINHEGSLKTAFEMVDAAYEAGAEVVFDQVLVVSGDEVKVGDPTVAGATVTATAVGDGKAKKVIVYKYKRKTGYHKKNGHRQAYTKVKIEKINA